MNKEFELLFKSDTDWHNNACLNFSHDMSHGYIEGYKRAADSLVIQINEKASGQDYLVYPIVFLYRQHLELLLKNTINNGRKLLEDGDGHPTHHKIDKLCPLVKGIARKVWQEKDPKDFRFIDHVIGELSKADPDSMSFRYPKDKKGNKANPDLYYVNLRHLAETINEVSSFVDGIDTGISYYLEQKYEYLRDSEL